MARAKAFWCGTLGLCAFKDKDNWLGWDGRTFPIHLMPPDEQPVGMQLSKHIALEVDALEDVLARLLDAEIEPFQVALTGARRAVVARDQPLDFGIGTLFVCDPDGNVIEFVQKGRGIFALGG